jgi:hypothetical protein
MPDLPVYEQTTVPVNIAPQIPTTTSHSHQIAMQSPQIGGVH